ncbi:DUF2586 domain-containing protein [Hahella ganghwensis]|uniref:DUF2586 domain-containing protein n=1 Tax=Hahella ganghwensis TaxID=286420 RepID=UPI00037907AD|nr:DUF2586 domain-containing protein [Hahella ganghwensis]
MAQGKVTVNNLNLSQGNFPEIERKALFIGVGSKNAGSVLSLNTQSNLDESLGVNHSDIKNQVSAAKANGGENWQAYAVPLNGGDAWQDALDQAMLTISPELVVLCTPAQEAADIEAMQTKAELIRTTLGRRVIILAATSGIDSDNQSWSDFEAAQAAIVQGLACPRVGVVPLLHGNDLGVLVGRLCNRAVSIADSPMRVATGSVLALGNAPVDSAGIELPDATLATLDANRLSCIQRYPDYPGTYWGDCNLLDVPAGDYQVIEHLRVVDKAARAIRILAIARVANRSLNSTPVSIAANKTYFMRPLREMSKSVVFAGTHFPGEIKPPSDDSIQIVWPTKNKVEVYLKVQPYNCPKDITANIILDLSNPSAG